MKLTVNENELGMVTLQDLENICVMRRVDCGIKRYASRGEFMFTIVPKRDKGSD